MLMLKRRPRRPGGLGVEADLRGLPKNDDCVRTDSQIFSESNSRYIVEVAPAKYAEFSKLMLNLPFGQIGKVTGDNRLVIKAEDQNSIVDVDLDTLKSAWQEPLDLG
jgi:phosphoribosylformylglycinamidine (FGAM) synthase-like enzyme